MTAIKGEKLHRFKVLDGAGQDDNLFPAFRPNGVNWIQFIATRCSNLGNVLLQGLPCVGGGVLNFAMHVQFIPLFVFVLSVKAGAGCVPSNGIGL